MFAPFSTGMRLWVLRTLLVALILSITASLAMAQLPTIVRVEEDWEVVVSTPDPNCDSPQITAALLPQGSTDGLFATFEVNHQDVPEYVAGGLQLQVWHGETPLGSRKFPDPSLLATPNETVRWTQSMTLSEGVLTFEITNGSSATWGSFGGQGYLRTGIQTSMTNLNSYDPHDTIDNSTVGYASNRIGSFVLVCVRLYTDTGEELEWHCEHPFHVLQ